MRRKAVILVCATLLAACAPAEPPAPSPTASAVRSEPLPTLTPTLTATPTATPTPTPLPPPLGQPVAAGQAHVPMWLSMSDDGSAAVYTGVSRSPENANYYIALPDGEPLPLRFEGKRSLGVPVISGDGSVAAFTAFNNTDFAPCEPDALEACGVIVLVGLPGGEVLEVIETGSRLDPYDRLALSDDGQTLAFEVSEGYAYEGVYVYDRAAGVITTIAAGDTTNPDVFFSTMALGISPDGGRVVFATTEPLSPRDTDEAPDIYTYDRAAGTLTPLPLPASDEPTGAVVYALSWVGDFSFSAEGRYMTFIARAANLTSDAIPQCTIVESGEQVPITCTQLYLYDWQTGEAELLSASTEGEAGDGQTLEGHLSADGRWVAFHSGATNLTADPITCGDFRCMWVYLRDRQRGETYLVSRWPGCEPVPAFVNGLTADASLLAFDEVLNPELGVLTLPLAEVLARCTTAEQTPPAPLDYVDQVYGIGGV